MVVVERLMLIGLCMHVFCFEVVFVLMLLVVLWSLVDLMVSILIMNFRGYDVSSSCQWSEADKIFRIRVFFAS